MSNRNSAHNHELGEFEHAFPWFEWESCRLIEGKPLMSSHLHKFDFRHVHVSELEIFVTSMPFMPSVATEEEIDWQIAALKADLDRLAKEMKKALPHSPQSRFSK